MAKKTVWDELGECIDYCCITSGKSMAQIARDAGVSEECLRLWRRGQSFPNQGNWEALAKALDIPVRELLIERTADRRRLKLHA